MFNAADNFSNKDREIKADRDGNQTHVNDFKREGLSMSIESRKENIVYFTYDHDEDYQKRHKDYLRHRAECWQAGRRNRVELESLAEVTDNMHIEKLIEDIDILFTMNEPELASKYVKNIVTYLQFVAHPAFDLKSVNVRLLYSYMENRPFHVVMLKQLYLLSFKAHYRTALEIAKMLLNIDPSDPLAVLSIIDALALRAKEYEWLIDAITYFVQQRQANLLFNIQYSNALAHFNVALENSNNFTVADRQLRHAIMSYPEAVITILKCAHKVDDKIINHKLFAVSTTSNQNLQDLIKVYAMMTGPCWRKHEVMEWFLRNVYEVAESSCGQIGGLINELRQIRYGVLRVLPIEVKRHVAVMRAMATSLIKTPLNILSPVDLPFCSWDPYFDSGHAVNRYNYI